MYIELSVYSSGSGLWEFLFGEQKKWIWYKESMNTFDNNDWFYVLLDFFFCADIFFCNSIFDIRSTSNARSSFAIHPQIGQMLHKENIKSKNELIKFEENCVHK